MCVCVCLSLKLRCKIVSLCDKLNAYTKKQNTNIKTKMFDSDSNVLQLAEDKQLPDIAIQPIIPQGVRSDEFDEQRYEKEDRERENEMRKEMKRNSQLKGGIQKDMISSQNSIKKKRKSMGTRDRTLTHSHSIDDNDQPPIQHQDEEDEFGLCVCVFCVCLCVWWVYGGCVHECMRAKGSCDFADTFFCHPGNKNTLPENVHKVNTI